jgi:CDP-glucose 4,6-dehydratase
MGVDPRFWAGRRVLVTGNTGFKGAWLSLWLLELGAVVHGLSDAVPTDPSLFDLAGLHAETAQHWVDVRDADAVAAAVDAAQPEVIFHLAAQPFVRRSFAEPISTYAVNVMGTAHVLDAVRRSPATTRVVVNVTSDKCYENREREAGYRENEPLGGHDPYSSSKAASELITAAFRASYFEDPDGPQIASARAGNVIGGGDWGEDRLVPDIVRAALAGEPVAIRRPDAVRPWQHVLNPLEGYITLAQAAWGDTNHATAYNFGPDERDVRPVSWLTERLLQQLGSSSEAIIDPGPHLHEAGLLSVDSSKARQALGWAPRWDLGAGLAATAAWYLAHGEDEAMGDVSRKQVSDFTGSVNSAQP